MKEKGGMRGDKNECIERIKLMKIDCNAINHITFFLFSSILCYYLLGLIFCRTVRIYSIINKYVKSLRKAA